MTKPNSVDAASLHPIVPRPLAEQVAEKAKRVFELMESQHGTKSFGSVEGTNILITIHRVENPYANCKSFDEVCKTFMEEDHEMRKFFGKDKTITSGDNARLNNEACDSERIKSWKVHNIRGTVFGVATHRGTCVGVGSSPSSAISQAVTLAKLRGFSVEFVDGGEAGEGFVQLMTAWFHSYKSKLPPVEYTKLDFVFGV